MAVCTLELPYIFGVMPETTRVPLWKDVLFERLRKMNPVMFTKGGIQHDSLSNMSARPSWEQWKMGNTGKDIRWGMKMSTGRI